MGIGPRTLPLETKTSPQNPVGHIVTFHGDLLQKQNKLASLPHNHKSDFAVDLKHLGGTLHTQIQTQPQVY